MVKIFPCGPIGGPKYIRALRGPLPEIDLVPTGGITRETVAEFITAGVAALGVGGQLLAPRGFDEAGLELIRANTSALLATVRAARAALNR